MKNEPISLEETKILLGYYGEGARIALISKKLHENNMNLLISEFNAMKKQYDKYRRKATESFNEKE